MNNDVRLAKVIVNNAVVEYFIEGQINKGTGMPMLKTEQNLAANTHWETEGYSIVKFLPSADFSIFKNYITELEGVLSKLNENEKKIKEDRKGINKKQSDYGIKGMNSDIQNSHASYQLDLKLQKITQLKSEVNEDLLKTRHEEDNITLEIDKILFDNSVMLNEIIKNFNSITKIIE